MQTQTIEKPDTDERVDDGTDDDTPKVFHYAVSYTHLTLPTTPYV